jgi:hypothetical protein
MEKYINVINSLFNKISDIHNETKKVNTHQRSLTLKDVISYAFMMSHKDISKGKAIDIVKKNFNIKADSSCFQRKLNNISTDFFKKIYSEINNKINNILDENQEFYEVLKILTNNYVEVKDENSDNLIPIAVDNSIGKT